ncbi:hypothetical protein E2C01_004851 [Portunus trituberculatus]|uniref:Uncharacterized protein n=1 Tax=Portunus trituberculatus TaxID=210409 RepID=A0A5B7CXJ8_PORTR|nr:hypothetical protein [Portunus trituberculatus]
MNMKTRYNTEKVRVGVVYAPWCGCDVLCLSCGLSQEALVLLTTTTTTAATESFPGTGALSRHRLTENPE